MKLLRALIASSSLLILLLVIAPRATRAWRAVVASDNQPPVANNDTYTRHGNGTVGPVLLNDSDPDANYPLSAVLVTTPSHGSLSGIDGNSFSYSLTQSSFVGTDSFTYRACDNLGACSNTATVTINVVNEAPVAIGEFFVARGATVFGPMMANDFDPDPGDQLFYAQVNGASHGTVFGLSNPPFPSDIQSYVPNSNYTGPDSFEYKVCDQLFACSAVVKVTFYVIQAGGENNGKADCNSPGYWHCYNSTSYTYQGLNKLASTTAATYAYDNNGSQLSKVDGSGMRTLAWDPEKRLKQVTLPGGLSVTYKYDALGRRIQRTTGAGADDRYVYDGEDVVADLNSSSVVTTTYLNGLGVDDHLRQTSAATGVSYFLTDHLGTTSALTDASGNVVETLAYDSFGNNAGSTRTRNTYTGRERDPDTGLLYYRARFYDPQLGRFISEDPIGFAGGDVNLYGYVWQNPLRHTDASGLDGWTGDLADTIDAQLERLRRYLTGLDPDAVNANTVLNYAFNTYKGAANLLRVGRGFGNYYYGKPCTVPADELFEDIGRASGIALLLAGPAAEVSGLLRAAGSARAMPGPVAAETAPSLDALSQAAGVADRGGLTAAGRSLTKHGAGARPGNTLFPEAKGNAATINQIGQNVVDDILTTPGTTIQKGIRGRFGSTIEVTAPDGRGIVYDANGKFLFFKE